MFKAISMSILFMFTGIVWWQYSYRVQLGSSKAGLGSCLMDHLLISLQKVRFLLFKHFRVCYSAFNFVVFMLTVKYCWTRLVERTGSWVFTQMAKINVSSATLLFCPVEARGNLLRAVVFTRGSEIAAVPERKFTFQACKTGEKAIYITLYKQQVYRLSSDFMTCLKRGLITQYFTKCFASMVWCLTKTW